MKKKVKGFTLVECIVAMALIGIASLFMCQIYAALASLEKSNKMTSTSLVEQMKIAERESKTASSDVTPEVVPITKGVKFKVKTQPSGAAFDDKNKEYDVELVVMKSKSATSQGENGESGKSYKMDEGVRYKFMLPT